MPQSHHQLHSHIISCMYGLITLLT